MKKRVEGGGCQVAQSGHERGDSKLSERYLRLVKVERAVTIASGEMYPVSPARDTRLGVSLSEDLVA